MSRRRRHPHGWIYIDAVAGVVLLGAILMLLGTVIARTRSISTRLSDQRAALHVAELTLLQLQANATPSTPPTTQPSTQPSDIDVTTATLPDAAPEGQRWTRVTAVVRGRSVSLVGLVPDGGGR